MTGRIAFVESAPGTVLVDDGTWQPGDRCDDRVCWACWCEDEHPPGVFRWTPDDPIFIPAALAAELAAEQRP